MPIKPENKALYPANWASEIRPAILARAGDKCEECGVANHAQGARDQYGEWHNWPDLEHYNSDHGWSLWPDGFPNIIRIVLTIAHLDHDPRHNDPTNLRALCQRCHNRYDAAHRAETRRASLPRKRGQVPLPLARS